jgi:hypothetical protein
MSLQKLPTAVSTNTTIIVGSIVLIIGSLFAIASSSIGIQLFNEDSSKKDNNKTKFNFLVINLVIALLTLLAGGGALIISIMSKNMTT